MEANSRSIPCAAHLTKFATLTGGGRSQPSFNLRYTVRDVQWSSRAICSTALTVFPCFKANALTFAGEIALALRALLASPTATKFRFFRKNSERCLARGAIAASKTAIFASSSATVRAARSTLVTA